MSNIFSGSDIVKMGVQIEKNGRDFYNTLVNQSKSPKAKELFKFLAGEEEKHIVAFQKILDKLNSSEPAQSYSGEYVAYMSNLASGYVFTQKDKGAEIAKKITDDKQAVDTGIKFEKDSIVFYEGMKTAVPQDEHKIIDELILQEASHLKKLTDLKTSL